MKTLRFPNLQELVSECSITFKSVRNKYSSLYSVQQFLSICIFLLGIEDKLISTNGYCIMITDEGASFLSDFKRYETKHESYISLLSQLFDGKGDKMTLAKNDERPVPRNATSLSIGVQQKSFCDAIFGLSETLWLDNGFGERFIFSAARP